MPRPKQNIVETKWVFRNKQDEHGVVTRNKARLVAKGYAQVTYDDVYVVLYDCGWNFYFKISWQ